jgi:hypothetical protein
MMMMQMKINIKEKEIRNQSSESLSSVKKAEYQNGSSVKKYRVSKYRAAGLDTALHFARVAPLLACVYIFNNPTTCVWLRLRHLYVGLAIPESGDVT